MKVKHYINLFATLCLEPLAELLVIVTVHDNVGVERQQIRVHFCWSTSNSAGGISDISDMSLIASVGSAAVSFRIWAFSNEIQFTSECARTSLSCSPLNCLVSGSRALKRELWFDDSWLLDTLGSGWETSNRFLTLWRTLMFLISNNFHEVLQYGGGGKSGL